MNYNEEKKRMEMVKKLHFVGTNELKNVSIVGIVFTIIPND